MWPPRVRSGLPLLVASVAATLLVLGPALRGGFLLRYDAVFVPRQPLTWDLLGLGASTPRAVPSDLVVALASHLLPGVVVGPLVLVGLLVLAAVGAGRLALAPMRMDLSARMSTTVSGTAAWGSAIAGVGYLWTAYVGERLLIGQWAVLVGYAALPWVVRASIRVAGHGRGWPTLVGWLAFGSLGGGATWVVVVPSAVVALVVAGPGRPALRRLGSLLALAAVVALPFAVPALTRPGGVPSNAAATAVFAPSPDTRLGSLGSLLTGGGIWSVDAVPTGRLTVVGSIGAALVLALGLVGWWLPRHRVASSEPLAGHPPAAHRPDRAILAVGVLGLVAAASGLVHPVADALARLPGGGLLRDSDRLLAPWCLLVAVGLGRAVPALATRWRVPAAYALGLLPVAVLPALAWGVGGQLRPVDYPRDYASVERMVDADPRPGAVLVLPFQAYRQLGWNHDQVSLSAVPRWLDRTVVSSSDLRVRVGGRTVVVPGEDRLATRAAVALAGLDPAAGLGRLGIRWVVTDVPARPLGEGPPPVSAPGVPTGLTPRFQGSTLTLAEVPDVDTDLASDPTAGYRPGRAGVLAGDAIWGLLVLGALAGAALGRRSGLLLFGNRQSARPDVSGAACDSS